VRFVLNGAATEVDAHPLARLLDVLRQECGLAGTKEGCGEGECGACTVLVDGVPVVSCLVPFAQVRDREVLTIEGPDPTLEEVRSGLAGNLCRCTGYEAIYRAVLDR
jgi:carbon-monoxide dehydrogenase small subunit